MTRIRHILIDNCQVQFLCAQLVLQKYFSNQILI